MHIYISKYISINIHIYMSAVNLPHSTPIHTCWFAACKIMANKYHGNIFQNWFIKWNKFQSQVNWFLYETRFDSEIYLVLYDDLILKFCMICMKKFDSKVYHVFVYRCIFFLHKHKNNTLLTAQFGINSLWSWN